MEQPTHFNIGEPAHNSQTLPTADPDIGAFPGAAPDGNATRIWEARAGETQPGGNPRI